jgi:hypothetical protein
MDHLAAPDRVDGAAKTPCRAACISTARCATLEDVGGVCQRIIYVAGLSRHSHWRGKIMLPRVGGTMSRQACHLQKKSYLFHTNSDGDDFFIRTL